MKIRDLFVSDVTRDIPPVVYFHEQSPEKLKDEVSEYIITGGWPEGHPSQRRVPNGIHEQYVRLLTAMAAELKKPGGPELPAAWISGFYGSGKSSFAKLLGLSLSGVPLPNGLALAEAWLRRNTSPRAAELRQAWEALRQIIDPIAVVFDIGGVARQNEHIHAAALRQLQKHLGYCSSEPLVAEFELRLERDGKYQAFLDTARTVLGRPWSEVKDKALAEEDFSQVMHVLFPDKYSDPMSWFMSRAGNASQLTSAEEITRAVADMLRFRAPDKTLFFVIDEVSQYLHQDNQRMLALQSFVSELGQRLKGKVWLLVTGQEKLEDAGDKDVLGKLKDRFPPKLRVHLSATNIRDVVHRRLLHKKPGVEADLRALFHKHRHDLKLFAYGCESITEDDFVEVYPMLPGHIDLLLQITSALRTRATRSQGDDQAIRGLLQLLGELFRGAKLAGEPVGTLITLDQIYDVQHTALESDIQASMARILSQCAGDDSGLLVRVAKAVALLELIQDSLPTDAKLVAACLYDTITRGNQLDTVTAALEELRRRNLLGYSEKEGYKIQSTAGEEWERERRDIGVAAEQRSELIQEALTQLLGTCDRAQLQGRSFPWEARFSDGRQANDVVLESKRDPASVIVDWRMFFTPGDLLAGELIRQSDESQLRGRILWVAGSTADAWELAGELGRSQILIRRLTPRESSLSPARKLLLKQEENRADDLRGRLRDAVTRAWMAGRMYFRGRELVPSDLGAGFAAALLAAGTRVLPELFPHLISTMVLPSELAQLLEPELSGPSRKFLPDELGILGLDAGRYVPECSGEVPRRIAEYIQAGGGVSGATLLGHFAGPPYAYHQDVVRACVAGLLRAGKLRIEPEGGTEITAPRDAGVRELFDKDRVFKSAHFFPVGDDDIGFSTRARICKFFEHALGRTLDREDHLIADAVAELFPAKVARLREVFRRLDELPGRPAPDDRLASLERALEDCLRKVRHTKPTVHQVKKHLDALNDGIQLLDRYHAELTPAAIAAVRRAADVRDHQITQLEEARVVLDQPVHAAKERIVAHLARREPWIDISALEHDLADLIQAYEAERAQRLAQQEAEVEKARARLKTRPGFATLSADRSHQVMRPLTGAVTETTPEAVAPRLMALRDSFAMALHQAEERANEILDGLLSQGDEPMIVKLELDMKNRIIRSDSDIETLVDEVRGRLQEMIRAGKHVRLT